MVMPQLSDNERLEDSRQCCSSCGDVLVWESSPFRSRYSQCFSFFFLISG